MCKLCEAHAVFRSPETLLPLWRGVNLLRLPTRPSQVVRVDLYPHHSRVSLLKKKGEASGNPLRFQIIRN